MSEVLRAILTAAAVSRQITFYSGLISSVTTVTGQKSFARRQATIPCKSDCYFLALGGIQASCINSTTLGLSDGWDGEGLASTWQIQRATNYQVYSSFPQVKPNLNYNLNNFAALGEYLLFKPAELITLVQDVQVTDITTAYTRTTFVTLPGIEYRMKG